jgi:hypothetical protein
VSSETALTSPGAAKSYSLMCYVSASGAVILVLTIGAAAIGMGTGPSNVENGFKVNVAVISFTSYLNWHFVGATTWLSVSSALRGHLHLPHPAQNPWSRRSTHQPTTTTRHIRT